MAREPKGRLDASAACLKLHALAPALRLPPLAPVVKLSATDSKAREVEVTVEGVPPGIGVKLSPERVKVAPVK